MPTIKLSLKTLKIIISSFLTGRNKLLTVRCGTVREAIIAFIPANVTAFLTSDITICVAMVTASIFLVTVAHSCSRQPIDRLYWKLWGP